MEEKYVPNVTELVTKGRADTKDQKQEMKIELFLWDFGGQASKLLPQFRCFILVILESEMIFVLKQTFMSSFGVL